MIIRNTSVAIISFILLLGCHSRPEKDFLLSEKDFIPEGTAYNEKNDILFIGSVYKQKIIGLDKEGREYEVIGKDKFGDYSPLGMDYDPINKRLWVCAAMAPLVHGQVEQWKTVVMAFDIDKSKLIKEYGRLSSKGPIFYNDITVTKGGVVYVTESINNRILRINPKQDSLELFIELENFNFPNGITHSDDFLFVATDQGIVRVDQQSKKLMLLKAKNGVDVGAIDGLEITDNCFIGHQSSKVVKFYFDKEKSSLTHAEILDTGDEFDSSTTGVIHDGYYQFIVNSQIRSGIDQPTKTIKPLDSLEEVIIRKIEL